MNLTQARQKQKIEACNNYSSLHFFPIQFLSLFNFNYISIEKKLRNEFIHGLCHELLNAGLNKIRNCAIYFERC